MSTVRIDTRLTSAPQGPITNPRDEKINPESSSGTRSCYLIGGVLLMLAGGAATYGTYLWYKHVDAIANGPDSTDHNINDEYFYGALFAIGSGVLDCAGLSTFIAGI